ncbi:MAG: formylglycine-generating enzyme family protein, partial [Treponema sp.]|nr:formylglycine-generating enzyme family protein [Treponema sp.]
YSGSNSVDAVAWYGKNSGSKTHPVKTKTANSLGLYDMSGNVWEWCWDRYWGYSSGAQTDPAGASSGTYRVARGGSWRNDAEYVRVAFRDYYTPSSRYDNLGFRLVRP